MDDRLQENGIHEFTAALVAHGSGQSDALRPLGVRPPPGTTSTLVQELNWHAYRQPWRLPPLATCSRERQNRLSSRPTSDRNSNSI
jgi:hypothetical protein